MALFMRLRGDMAYLHPALCELSTHYQSIKQYLARLQLARYNSTESKYVYKLYKKNKIKIIQTIWRKIAH
jgi:hypothetical protein